ENEGERERRSIEKGENPREVEWEREEEGRGDTLTADTTLQRHHRSTSDVALATGDEEVRTRRRTPEASRPCTAEPSATLTDRFQFDFLLFLGLR
ncbi:hypothetical protein U1Q18_026035, partial [Sarracenia purpurea var. burkii]